jgi:hypothetical protein
MHIFRDRSTRLWAEGWDWGIMTTDHHFTSSSSQHVVSSFLPWLDVSKQQQRPLARRNTTRLSPLGSDDNGHGLELLTTDHHHEGRK